MKRTLIMLAALVLCGVILAAVFLVGCDGKGASPELPVSSEEQAGQPSAASGAAPEKAASTSMATQSSEALAGTDTGAAFTGLSLGDIAPDFELELMGGGTVKLSDLRGKPVLLNISTTWCGPCQEEFPELEEVYGKYGDDVHILCISSGEAKGAVDAFFGGSYTFPVAYDDEYEMSTVYEVQFIPQSYFLDAEGVICEYIPGGTDYDGFTSALDELLGR